MWINISRTKQTSAVETYILLRYIVETPDRRSTRRINIYAFTIAIKISYNLSNNIKTFKTACRLLLARLSG